MRKIRITLLLFSVIFLLSSCEKEIEFDKQYDSGIAIYALAIPGKPFAVRISHSFTVNDNPAVVFSHYGEYYDEIDSLYHSQIVIKGASAEILVNGVDRYILHYRDENPYPYICDYIPNAGDVIALTVKAQGFDDVSATATIERPQPVEIVNTQVIYKDNGDDGSIMMDNPLDHFGVDSVMLITLRIDDPVEQHNYYRLKVRGIAEREEMIFPPYKTKFWSISDVFTSDDIIFVDNQLTKPFSDWEAGFSNVFDDHLFNGESYTFTVETRKRYGDNAHVELELQSLSRDMYYFLKSYLLFRISTDDVYMSPVGLHSNIANGWGIFGTLSYDRHVIYY